MICNTIQGYRRHPEEWPHLTSNRLIRVVLILLAAALGVPSLVWSQSQSRIIVRAAPAVAQQVATKYGLTAVAGFAPSDGSGNLHLFRIPEGQSADAIVSAIAVEIGVANVERNTPLQLPVRLSLPDGFRLGLGILAVVLLLTGLGQLFWRDIRQELEPVLQLTDSVVTSEQDS